MKMNLRKIVPLIGLGLILLLAAFLLQLLDWRGAGDGSAGGKTGTPNAKDGSKANSDIKPPPDMNTTTGKPVAEPQTTMAMLIHVNGSTISVEGRTVDAGAAAKLAKNDTRPVVVVWHPNAVTSVESKLISALQQENVAFSQRSEK